MSETIKQPETVKRTATAPFAVPGGSAKTAQERRDSLWVEGWRPLDVGLLFISKSGNEIAVVTHDGTYFRGIKQNEKAEP